jgi:excisionase family DNA binding protein
MSALIEEIKVAVREVVREEIRSALMEQAHHPDAADDHLVDVSEAARRLGLSRSTIYKCAERCELPSIKVGARLLFKRADLAAYTDARRRSPEVVARLARRERTGHNVIHNDENDD